ncbi:MAG: Brp/Blh family beta-carotene 15,15'-dioxygenase [Winogradskyella sp.]|uniref:Brp/Blh family beta-carotene 15,15'-dioxygenase n=1 Tax=Winogradskyella sp. TaxID=1883156 RepID=UPI00385EA7B4
MRSTISSLILTVFILWFTIQIDSDFEIYLAYILILTIGIVHGANDISLIGLLTKNSKKATNTYLLVYLALIAFTCFVFFKFPPVALLIFIAFSCYHFGEQHFYDKLEHKSAVNNVLFFGYGALIFGMLFYFNSEATLEIIFELAGLSLLRMHFLVLAILGATITILFYALNRENFKKEYNVFEELFLILLFALVFQLATLLWAFAIYFIIWHSLPSLKDQTQALYGSVTKTNFLKYLKSSLLNWAISIIGLAIVYYISVVFQIRFIVLFFAFLSAITIPHVIVMYYLNKK